MSLRKFRLDDEHAVYDICLRTGRAGADATDLYEDPRLIGHVYAGPYLRFAPQFATVVDEGQVLGYVLAAPDTREFEARCEEEWWPALRKKYPNPPELLTPDQRLMRVIHSPHRTPEGLVGDYPSHLHIDLLPAAQGRGHGRTLINRLEDELRDAGSPGVHLGFDPANTAAAPFYTKLGFHEAARDEWVVWMAKSLV
ncbi:GNAT family N-acetyltransferase [Actinocorallia longicatena]|uniref:N-acetyltransferase domain-containing protein n=1 Tax=Actinocorallia longicatena TaxID=111803 RepID=A0ABP6QL55_9ACTN